MSLIQMMIQKNKPEKGKLKTLYLQYQIGSKLDRIVTYLKWLPFIKLLNPLVMWSCRPRDKLKP